MRPRLRLYTGEEDSFETSPTKSITLGELLRVLDDAHQGHRTWIHDFSRDDIHISEDLYEVLTEYTRLRPGA